MHEVYGTWFVINPRRMHEGYGTWFVDHSFVHSVQWAAETIAQFWNSIKVWTGLAWQWLAMWLVNFAKVLSFSGYGWLALTAVFDLSDNKSAHSWLLRYL